MDIDGDFQTFVENADSVIRAEQRFHEVMAPLAENFLDPERQEAAAAFLTSSELQRATTAAQELHTMPTPVSAESEQLR